MTIHVHHQPQTMPVQVDTYISLLREWVLYANGFLDAAQYRALIRRTDQLVETYRLSE